MTTKMNQADVTEASMLGWRPGYFAEHFVDRNGKTWARVRVEARSGEIVAVHYVAHGGGRLVVLND